MLEGVPILDYTPQTLLGVTVLMILFGLLVPYRVVKQLMAEIAYLRMALTKSQEALTEEQETGKVVRHFISGLSQGIDK